MPFHCQEPDWARGGRHSSYSQARARERTSTAEPALLNQPARSSLQSPLLQKTNPPQISQSPPLGTEAEWTHVQSTSDLSVQDLAGVAELAVRFPPGTSQSPCPPECTGDGQGFWGLLWCQPSPPLTAPCALSRRCAGRFSPPTGVKGKRAGQHRAFLGQGSALCSL